MWKFKLGIIVGSNRKESINLKLANALVKLGAGAYDAKFIPIDDLPMYSQDNEHPVPTPVARFKSEVETVDALLFVTPEHSRSIPAVLEKRHRLGRAALGQDVLAGQARGHHRNLRRRDFHGHRPAAFARGARQSGPARGGRRSLYCLQA